MTCRMATDALSGLQKLHMPTVGLISEAPSGMQLLDGGPINRMIAYTANNVVVLRYSASAIVSAGSGRSSHNTSNTLAACSGRFGCP